MFHCGVLYEDSLYSPFKGQLELHEDVKIYIEENYEQINVPVPQFGGSDPADIIHDFQRVRSSWDLGGVGLSWVHQLCVHAPALSLLSRGLFLSCPPARGPLWVFPTLSCLPGEVRLTQFPVFPEFPLLPHFPSSLQRVEVCNSVLGTQGLTAYHDITLDKCYVIELNTTIVMPPRNLWELLVNVKVQLQPCLLCVLSLSWLQGASWQLLENQNCSLGK